MAYAPGIRIGYFSNPDISHLGAATGVTNVANNAAVLNYSAPFAAAYREDTGKGNGNSIGGGSSDGGESAPGSGGSEKSGEADLNLVTIERISGKKKRGRYVIGCSPIDDDGNAIALKDVEFYQFKKKKSDKLLGVANSNSSGLATYTHRVKKPKAGKTKRTHSIYCRSYTNAGDPVDSPVIKVLRKS